MPAMEQSVEPRLYHPAKQPVDDRAARQVILQTIGQAGLSAGILKLVPMDPPGEGPLDLFVHEQHVFFIHRVQRDPGEYSYTKFYPRTGPDATSPGHHPHHREFWREEREGILPLVKAEDHAYGCIDENALDEGRHVCRLLGVRV